VSERFEQTFGQTVSPTPDGAALSETLLCEIVGCTQQLRQTWVRRKLLPSRKDGYGELDVTELAVLIRLHGSIGPRDTSLIWPATQELLRTEMVRGRWDLVVDLQHKNVEAVRDDEALSEAVRHGRPVRVLPLGDELGAMHAAARRVLNRLAETSSTSRAPRARATRRSTSRDLP
jgi:hypothetical protein